MTDNTVSEVDNALDDWDAGKLNRHDLLGRLAKLPFKDVCAAGMVDGGAPDFPQPGTLEEVQAAAVAGRLTEEEVEVIVSEALALAAERHLVAGILTEDGRVRDRST
jgi:hypothetical protein